MTSAKKYHSKNNPESKASPLTPAARNVRAPSLWLLPPKTLPKIRSTKQLEKMGKRLAKSDFGAGPAERAVPGERYREGLRSLKLKNSWEKVLEWIFEMGWNRLRWDGLHWYGLECASRLRMWSNGLEHCGKRSTWLDCSGTSSIGQECSEFRAAAHTLLRNAISRRVVEAQKKIKSTWRAA